MKKKNFDCVEMKHEIQRKIYEEEKGLSREEIVKRREELIAADQILGPFVKRLAERDPNKR